MMRLTWSHCTLLNYLQAGVSGRKEKPVACLPSSSEGLHPTLLSAPGRASLDSVTAAFPSAKHEQTGRQKPETNALFLLFTAALLQLQMHVSLAYTLHLQKVALFFYRHPLCV